MSFFSPGENSDPIWAQRSWSNESNTPSVTTENQMFLWHNEAHLKLSKWGYFTCFICLLFVL